MAERPDAVLEFGISLVAGALDVGQREAGKKQGKQQDDGRQDDERRLDLFDPDILHGQAAEDHAGDEIGG